MNHIPRRQTFAALVLLTLICSVSWGVFSDLSNSDLRSQSRKQFTENNIKEAYDGFSELATRSDTGGKELVQDMNMLFQCMQRLRKYTEFDQLIEKIIAAHPKDWRVLSQAIQQYQSVPKHGVLVDNQWQRAPQRITG